MRRALLLGRWLLPALLGWACTSAVHADDPAAARQRIVLERAQLDQAFQAEERACAGRFAVNACIEDVRSRRRAALGALRERELVLDEQERVRRGEERRAAVARKQAERDARPALPPEAPEASRPASAPATPAVPWPPAQPEVQAVPPPSAAEAAAAAARAQQLREARRRAEAAEVRIRERQARQAEEAARKGRPVDRLPAPGAVASAPAR